MLPRRAAEMSERTPTTQEHWERYADELLGRAERAEARVKELEEELTAIKHEAWRLVQVLNAYDGSGIPRLDASDAFAFLQKIGVERVLRGEGGE